MQVAILVSTVAILLAYLSSYKVFKYGLEIAMLLLTVFVAIRYEWGTDMAHYYESFAELSNYELSFQGLTSASQNQTVKSVELGWTLLNLLCMPIGFFGMNIVVAIVEGIIIYDFIKKYVDRRYYWLAIFIYTMNPYLMVLGCSMMRQWIAMCIILFSIRYVISGRFYLFALFVLLASSFHNSALLFLILYPFRYFNSLLRVQNFSDVALLSFAWVVIGSMLPLGSIMALVSGNIFDGYEGYMSNSGSQGLGLGFGSLFIIIVYLYCIFQAHSLSKEKKLLCWFLMVYIFLFPFTNVVPMASRLAFYVDAISMASIPIAMKASNNKVIKYGIIVLLVFWDIYLYKLFFAAPSFYYPYQTYHTIFESPYWL